MVCSLRRQPQRQQTKLEILGGLPSDACWHVGAAIAAGTIRDMLTNGTLIHRGESLLNWISFEGSEVDLADHIGMPGVVKSNGQPARLLDH